MSPSPGGQTVLTRDCRAVLVPSGQQVTLPGGTEVVVVQTLGGSVTVQSDRGYLARIAPGDADALALEEGDPDNQEPDSQEPATQPSPDVGPFSTEKVIEALKTVYDHVVGEDLEPWAGVDLGVVREEQVLVGLAGIGAKGARTDDDVPVEDPVPVAVDDADVALLTHAVRRGVLDEDRVVVVLGTAGEVEPVEVCLGAVAVEENLHLVAGDARAERDEVRGEPAARGLADHERGEVERLLGLVL